jgi:hypothetical protein
MSYTPDQIKRAMRHIATSKGSATREEAIELLDFEHEQEGEMRAEFGMSWVCGGGRAEDVSSAWAMHRDDYIAGRIG